MTRRATSARSPAAAQPPAAGGDGLTIRALSAETWQAYASMVERHNGVFGGCWCTWFHRPAGDSPGVEGLGNGYESNQRIKEGLVREGRSRAALVFDGPEVVAWCQFGTPDELPNIYHRKQYLEEAQRLPDYRVTCIFVDKRYRRRGMSAAALQGALDLIAASGGGLVEGYPHDTGGKRQSVLYNGTRSLFADAGFTYDRAKGAKNTVMVKTVAPAGRAAAGGSRSSAGGGRSSAGGGRSSADRGR